MFDRVRVRFISSVLFAPLMLALITYSAWTCFALLLFVALATVVEFYSLGQKMAVFPQKIWGTSLVCILYSVVFAVLHCKVSYLWMCIVPAAVSLVYLFELYAKHRSPFTNIAYTLTGLLYVGGGFSLLHAAAFSPSGVYNCEVVAGALLLTWANDTGAYLLGSALGKRKLFERISPNKSWEGAFGGAIAVMCTSCALSFQCSAFPQTYWIGLGIIAAVCGTYGDLVESMLKRSAGVKDSGCVIPGHGGLLDRFDSLLMMAPWMWCFTKFME